MTVLATAAIVIGAALTTLHLAKGHPVAATRNSQDLWIGVSCGVSVTS